MITFRQFKKDERWAITVITKFIHNHPIATLLISTTIIAFIIVALGFVMMLAAVGGGYAETNFKDQFESGQITPREYHLLTMGMGIFIWCYNFIDALVGFIMGFVILLWTYIGLEEYLIYKRDNL